MKFTHPEILEMAHATKSDVEINTSNSDGMTYNIILTNKKEFAIQEGSSDGRGLYSLVSNSVDKEREWLLCLYREDEKNISMLIANLFPNITSTFNTTIIMKLLPISDILLIIKKAMENK